VPGAQRSDAFPTGPQSATSTSAEPIALATVAAAAAAVEEEEEEDAALMTSSPPAVESASFVAAIDEKDIA